MDLREFLRRPDSNQAPSEEELPRIRAWRQACISGIDQLNRQIEELIAQRKCLEDELDHYDALLSPIKCIPAEILSKIFHHATVIPDKALKLPTVVASTVCQRWRQLAIDTPTLWTNIVILIPNHPCLVYQRRVLDSPELIEAEHIWTRRMERLLEITQIWIDRSKECPVSIMLRFSTVDQSPGHHWQDAPSAVSPLYQAFVDLASSVAHRWRAVDLDIVAGDQTIVQSILSIESHHVPQLEAISFQTLGRLDRTRDPPFYPSGLLGAPSIRSIFLLHMDRPWTQLPINWRGLRKLRFAVRTDGLEVGKVVRTDLLDVGDVPMSVVTKVLGPLGALSLLQACPELEECELSVDAEDEDDRDVDRRRLRIAVDRTGVLRMAHMKSLILHASEPVHELMAVLQLPSLQQLHSLTSYVGEVSKSERAISSSRFLYTVGRFGAQLTDIRFSLLLLEDTTTVIPCFSSLPNLLSLQLDTGIADTTMFGPAAEESVERSAVLLLGLLTPTIAEGGVLVAGAICPKLKRFACTLRVKGFTERQLLDFIMRRSIQGIVNSDLAKVEEVDVAFVNMAQGIDIRSTLKEEGVDLGGMKLRIQYCKPRWPLGVR